jgi:hypothetical protein
MTSKHVSTVPWTALASVLIALAVGLAPVATLIAFSERMGQLQ